MNDSPEREIWQVYAQLLDRDLLKLHEEIAAFNHEENIWKTAGSIINSAGTLCLHLTGSLNHFVGATMGHTGFVRDREGEFAKRNIPREDMLRDLGATREMVVKVMASQPEGTLTSIFPRKFMEQDVTHAWFLSHIITHVNYHLGQVNYLRRALEG
ncbi:DinB family protein [Chitinophaga sp.]|uniref:DinB family protein n=1 Tax=Chitinophaga sp. TaxID=1869181 RepID=UPI00262631BE|nr:DinB family protein [uncultured Chitinophaga sp.]